MGSEETAENREAMIQHHPGRHQDRHLQFRLKASHEVIRIRLEFLDHDDYLRCIRGFLSVSQKIIESEQADGEMPIDLDDYFFNDLIDELDCDRQFLLGKIKLAYQSENILGDGDAPVTQDKLEALKEESHLLPFLDWE